MSGGNGIFLTFIYYYKQGSFSCDPAEFYRLLSGEICGSRRSAFHSGLYTQLSVQEMADLWNGSLQEGNYTTLVLDGDYGRMRCRYWKMPGDLHADPGGPVFAEKMREFEEYLGGSGNGAVMEKIQKIQCRW